jgi:hypothetical protein
MTMTASPSPAARPTPGDRRRRTFTAVITVLIAGAASFAAACTSGTFSLAPDAGTLGSISSADGGADADPVARGDAADAATKGALVTGNLSFGAVDCGAAAAARAVTVENLGGQAFTFKAALSGGAASPFTLTPKLATVPGHGKVVITVTPLAIPSTSAVPGTYGDALTVTTDLVDDHPRLIPISETAQGAIFSFDTQAIPFGQVPVSSSQSSTFHVTNSGNVPAKLQLGIGMPSAQAFAVNQTTTALAAGESLTANVTFSPTATGPFTSSVVIMPITGTALCAPLPSGVALSGVGENGGLALSSNAITFGPTSCGTTSAAQSLKLTNSGNAPLTWSASLANRSPSPYTVSPAMTGSLAAGASIDLSIAPGPIPASSSVQADFYGDTLTVNTDVIGDEPHVVTLSQTASGAILAFNPASVNFGDVPVGGTGMAQFQVVNTGNVDARVTVSGGGAGFSATPSAATTVAHGSEVAFTGAFAPGSTTTTVDGTFSVATTSPLCGPLPSALMASGTGTKGVVSFSPGALSFGNQGASGFTACGTQATPLQVTFTNSGNQSYTITPELVGGTTSPYTFTVAPTSGVVAASGGTATITVTPLAIPGTSAVPGSYNDTLSVTTTASGDTGPHTIALTQSAYGAVLTGAPPSIAFPSTPELGQSSLPVGITNNGNAGAVLVWNSISSSAFAFDQSVTAPPGGVSTSPLAYFRPAAAQAYTGTAVLGVSATTILCQSIPNANVSLSGTGTTGSVVSVTPAQVDFNMVSCGTSGGSDPVSIKNNSTASITWSATLPTGSAFTLSAPSSGTLASGATATVTVTSVAIPVSPTTTTASNGFGSQLTVTTNAPNDVTHLIPILETASGAILTFNPTSLTLPLAQRGMPVPFAVQNSGNVGASITLTLNPSAVSTLTLNNPTSGMVASGAPLDGSVTESVASSPSTDATVSLTAAPGTILCQPSPAPMTITAN